MVQASSDLVVVSHACVLAENQRPYAELVGLGADVQLIVPSTWRNEYATTGLPAQVADGLADRVHPVRVIGRGRPQRHLYVTRPTKMLKDLGARVVLIEEEPFSLAAAQWSRAAKSLSIPYGVQLAETLPRSLPSPVAASRDRVLRDAAFVVARSPAAATLASTWGATGDVVVIAHGVDEAPMRPDPSGPFTVAFVGRLVEEKGVDDLLAAARQLDGAIRVVVAGDGPLAGRVRSAGSGVELLGAVPHDRIGDVYAQAHVTCVPSRTTPRWEEQFGRVLVESLVRGVPVVAASTGEIPWVLGLTGGGTLVRESDPAGLADALTRLADDPLGTAELGRTGRSGVLAHFTNRAAAHTLLEVLGRLSGR